MFVITPGSVKIKTGEIEKLVDLCSEDEQIEHLAIEAYWQQQQGKFPMDFMLAHHGPRLAGFLQFHSERQGLMIRTCMIHPVYRRLNIASALLSRLKTKAVTRCVDVAAIVPEESLAMQCCLRRNGFTARPWDVSKKYGHPVNGVGAGYYFFDWRRSIQR